MFTSSFGFLWHLSAVGKASEQPVCQELEQKAYDLHFSGPQSHDLEGGYFSTSLGSFGDVLYFSPPYPASPRLDRIIPQTLDGFHSPTLALSKVVF